MFKGSKAREIKGETKGLQYNTVQYDIQEQEPNINYWAGKIFI